MKEEYVKIEHVYLEHSASFSRMSALPSYKAKAFVNKLCRLEMYTTVDEVYRAFLIKLDKWTRQGKSSTSVINLHSVVTTPRELTVVTLKLRSRIESKILVKVEVCTKQLTQLLRPILKNNKSAKFDWETQGLIAGIAIDELYRS